MNALCNQVIVCITGFIFSYVANDKTTLIHTPFMGTVVLIN